MDLPPNSSSSTAQQLNNEHYVCGLPIVDCKVNPNVCANYAHFPLVNFIFLCFVVSAMYTSGYSLVRLYLKCEAVYSLAFSNFSR
jgi:hypothetical protein